MRKGERRSRGRASRLGAAEVLAALSRVSTRRGDISLARIRLSESLGLAQSTGSDVAGAAALDAAAELAEAVGELERAVEFHAARQRILLRSGNHEVARAPEERSGTPARLRSALGEERFEAARTACQSTPFPFELYACRALQWLDGLESRHRPEAAQADRADPATPSEGLEGPGSTARLIIEARGGSLAARGRLAGRHLAPLRRFAHGRLPGKARDLMDTDDLVQVTVVRALEKLHGIEPNRRGGFFAYLRGILVNQIRDEVRRTSRNPRTRLSANALQSMAPSPLDESIERESAEAYGSALARLSPRQREAVALRIEQGYSYRRIADATGCASANAARMVVSRALTALAKHMRRAGGLSSQGP